MRFALFFLLMVLATPFAWGAANYDFSPAKQAIAQLKALPDAVNKVVTIVNGTNFGPFPLSGSCGYDAHWYTLGIPAKTWRWSWRPGYSWLKSTLQANYNNLGSQASDFNGSFQPVRQWLTVTLPAFSGFFEQQTQQMLSATSVLSDANASAAARAAAANTIRNGFNAIQNKLESDTQQLSASISSLGAFNRRFSATLNNINGLKSQMEQMLSNADARLNREIVGWPGCAQGQIKGAYGSVKGRVRSQFNGVLSSSSQFGVTSTNVDNAVSVILGTLVNFKNGYQGILRNLHDAKITPAGAVQALRIHVAQKAWEDLATYAREQLD